MHTKWVLALLGSAMLSLFAAGAAFATAAPEQHAFQSAQMIDAQHSSPGSEVNISTSVTSTITATVTPTATLPPGIDKIAKAIATRFGVDEKGVLTIHDQVHGWGEVFLIYALADLADKSPEQIMTLRESDGGWGLIFMTLGFHPGLKRDNLGGAITGRATPTAAPTGVFSTNKHKSNENEAQDSNDDRDQCNNHSNSTNNKDKNHPCITPTSNQFQPGNGDSDYRPDNKGKGH